MFSIKVGKEIYCITEIKTNPYIFSGIYFIIVTNIYINMVTKFSHYYFHLSPVWILSTM